MEDKPYKKCKFTEGSNTCTEVARKCSEFNFDSIANICYNNTLSLDTKRCSYSNNACSLIDIPNCLELYHRRMQPRKFVVKQRPVLIIKYAL